MAPALQVPLTGTAGVRALSWRAVSAWDGKVTRRKAEPASRLAIVNTRGVNIRTLRCHRAPGLRCLNRFATLSVVNPSMVKTIRRAGAEAMFHRLTYDAVRRATYPLHDLVLLPSGDVVAVGILELEAATAWK